MPDLNAYTVEEAMNIVAGTARNMGIAVKGMTDTEMEEEVEEAQEAEREAAKREAALEAMEQSLGTETAEVEVITEKTQTEEEN